MPARVNSGRLALASGPASMPSHVSAPHSPVANASVNAVTPGGSVERPFATIGVGAPLTAVEIVPLSGASATGTCLYGLYTKSGAAPRMDIDPRSGWFIEVAGSTPIGPAHPAKATANADQARAITRANG